MEQANIYVQIYGTQQVSIQIETSAQVSKSFYL